MGPRKLFVLTSLSLSFKSLNPTFPLSQGPFPGLLYEQTRLGWQQRLAVCTKAPPSVFFLREGGTHNGVRHTGRNLGGKFGRGGKINRGGPPLPHVVGTDPCRKKNLGSQTSPSASGFGNRLSSNRGGVEFAKSETISKRTFSQNFEPVKCMLI